MLIVLIVTLLVTGSQAAKADFPAFDPGHSNCALSTTFPGRKCTDLTPIFLTVVGGLSPDPMSGGIYSVKE